jgi:hypothetical protein
MCHSDLTTNTREKKNTMSRISTPIKKLLEELNEQSTYGYYEVLKENSLIRPYLLRWHDQIGRLHVRIPENTEHYKETYGGLHMTEMFYFMLGLIEHKKIENIMTNVAEEMKEL